MKLSLKQARRVEREIGAELEIDTVGGRRNQATFSIYESLRDKVAAIQKETVDGLLKVKELTRIRFAIRKAIETENEVSGLNALMNREAELKSLAKVLTSLMTVELTDEDLEIAVQRHAAAKAANEKGTVVQSRYGESTDELTLGTTLRTETLESLRVYAKQIQRELLTVVDQLAALNATRSISLGEIDAKALEDAGIVL
jgi:hypothetical protein